MVSFYRPRRRQLSLFYLIALPIKKPAIKPTAAPIATTQTGSFKPGEGGTGTGVGGAGVGGTGVGGGVGVGSKFGTTIGSGPGAPSVVVVGFRTYISDVAAWTKLRSTSPMVLHVKSGNTRFSGSIPAGTWPPYNGYKILAGP